MKLPLIITDEKGRNGIRIQRPLLNCVPKIAGRRLAVALQMLVDTGSGLTLIGPIDSQRLRIPLQGKPMPVYVGGQAVPAYPLPRMVLVARTEDNKTFDINVPRPYGTKQMLRRGKKQDKIMPLRSIIGVDALQDNRLRLIYDTANRSAYLETC